MEIKNYYLVVPTKLRYLKIDNQNKKEAYTYQGQLADFTRLPHRGLKSEDGCVFPKLSPNVSEDLVTKPFESTSQPLRTGIHVHFSLPSALRKARVIDHSEGHSKMIFPKVPNRWMIKRKVIKNGKDQLKNKEFLLESDTLSLENSGNSNAIPFKSSSFKNGDIPYRFLGCLSDINRESGSLNINRPINVEGYLKDLNAFGYGEPLFSSYYPECKNVFGFHDDINEIVADAKATSDNVSYKVSYEVTGWYSDGLSDPFMKGSLVFQSENLLSEAGEIDGNEGAPTNKLKDIRIESEDTGKLDWEITYDENNSAFDAFDPLADSISGRCIFAGKVKNIMIDFSSTVNKNTKERNLADTKIVIANSPGQAMAALLSYQEKGKDRVSKELLYDAYQLGLFTKSDQIDILAKVDDGIHKSAFTPESGGTKWTISRARPELPQQGTALNSIEKISGEAKTQVLRRFSDLSRLQKSFDSKLFSLKDERLQLYADWYKYIITEYDLKLGPITRDNRTNDIRMHLKNAATFILEKENKLQELKRDIEALQNEVENLLNEWNNNATENRYQYSLRKSQASRFWSPIEPTILFHGDNIDVSNRIHGKSTLKTRLFVHTSRLSDETKDAIGQLIDFKELIWSNFDFLCPEETLNHIDWEPLYLDWQVKMIPTTKPFNFEGSQLNWAKDSILENFSLPDDTIDFKRKGKSKDQNKSQAIDGRSILSSGSNKTLAYYLSEERKKIPLLINELSEEDSRLTGKDADTLKRKTEISNNISKYKNLLVQLDEEIKKLENLKTLSQSLSGFNDACLMMKQILQLEVGDPLADNKELDHFSNQLIKKAIGNSGKVSPLPSNFFIPIRDGWMKINRLRLVDCFGQYVEWEHNENLKTNSKKNENDPRIIIAENLKPNTIADNPFAKYCAYLPPRLVQPCRLNTTFLAPDLSIELDENNFVDFNPIVGWILPNYLDGTLFVYDAEGLPLGYFQEQIQSSGGSHIYFLNTPGNDMKPEILNKNLDDWIEFFKAQEGTYLRDFIKNTVRALKSIDPENYGNFTGINSLLGKPLALVNLELSLEIKGDFAKNQSWSSRLEFFKSKKTSINDSFGFQKVKFPLRIGDVSQSNDGLVGYYLIERNKPQYSELYSIHAEEEIGTPAFELESLKETREIAETVFQKMNAGHMEPTDEDLNLLESLRRLGENTTPEQKKKKEELESKIQSYKEYREIKDIFSVNIEKELKKAEEGVSIGFFKRPREQDLSVAINNSGKIDYTIKTMCIVDPRAKVHITSGILPVKSVQLNEDLVAEALNNIEASFMTTPVLSPSKQIILPTFIDDAFTWSWLEKHKVDSFDEWKSINNEQFIQPDDDFMPIDGKIVIKEGWLKINSKSPKPSNNE